MFLAAALNILCMIMFRIDDALNVDVGDRTLIIGEMQFDLFEGAIFRFGQQIVDRHEPKSKYIQY